MTSEKDAFSEALKVAFTGRATREAYYDLAPAGGTLKDYKIQAATGTLTVVRRDAAKGKEYKPREQKVIMTGTHPMCRFRQVPPAKRQPRDILSVPVRIRIPLQKRFIRRMTGRRKQRFPAVLFLSTS